MRNLLILLIILLASCSLNKVVQHHGVHNLEKKQEIFENVRKNNNELIEL